MNFFDAILTYRMDVITAIKNRWIKKNTKVQQKKGVKQTRTGALQQQRHDQVPWMLH